MEVYWKNYKIKQLFESEQALLDMGFDKKEAKKAFKAIANIVSVTSINQLPKNMRCHPIKEGKKFIYFAVDIPSIGGRQGKNRIIFVPVGEEYDLTDLKTINKVEIQGIKDHH